ncbi:MAG: carboxymuconolactone decarboxylase family protein [Novosphingobium sp.]|nr:carboxymuconolactone decarboxylase family protein [Novosphingobium sp.]
MSSLCNPRIRAGLGGPPRLRPIGREELTARMRAALAAVEGFGDSGEDSPLHPFPATMVRHVDLFERYMAFGMNILNHALIPARDREILTLRTGWLCDAPFEWGAHVKLGLEAGLTREEIERIKIGPSAPGWSVLDRALLRAVDEMHFDSTIHDETWNLLADHYDDLQLIEVPLIVGQYHMTAFFQNALRFRPPFDAEGRALSDSREVA